VVRLNTQRAFLRLEKLDLLGFLDDFLRGDVDLVGNLYVLSDLKNCVRSDIKAIRAIGSLAANSWFQSRRRTAQNVRSHYDIPQEVLSTYLDRAYQSYTCAIFDDPSSRPLAELVTIGTGQDDSFDSLERAQSRKFREALELLDISEAQSMLDIGCGYGGLMQEALKAGSHAQMVGWTHSRNQVVAARGRLDSSLGECEIREGDYRQETRAFDRVASIGMVSHVGPRGLGSYCRNVRERIRKGGLYLHHDLMIEASWLPQNLQVGLVFNKKYVWPGFHWFTLSQHLRALEAAGFRVRRVDDLSEHYAKTTAAWHERLLLHQAVTEPLMGQRSFRAWQIFLAGISGSLDNGGVRDYRLLCEAI